MAGTEAEHPATVTAGIADLHARACEEFGRRVRAVRADQWGSPTPCTDWDVRTLVNHVVAEDRWNPPLLAGATMAEVGDRFDGDLLGADPARTYEEAAQEAVAAVTAPGSLARTVHLSFGDAPGSEYVWQWFAEQEEAYRSGGVIGPRVSTPAGAGTQTVLLAAFGRPATPCGRTSAGRSGRVAATPPRPSAVHGGRAPGGYRRMR